MNESLEAGQKGVPFGERSCCCVLRDELPLWLCLHDVRFSISLGSSPEATAQIETIRDECANKQHSRVDSNCVHRLGTLMPEEMALQMFKRNPLCGATSCYCRSSEPANIEA